MLLLLGCSQKNTICSKNCCQNKTKSLSKNRLNFEVKDSIGNLKPEVLACTLVGQEQFERKEELKVEIFSSVKGIEEIETGYVFNFDESEGFLLKLIDYILVEKECCPFLAYGISIQPYGKGVELKVSGSKEAKEIITLFVEENLK